jgi:hypothetical protein
MANELAVGQPCRQGCEGQSRRPHRDGLLRRRHHVGLDADQPQGDVDCGTVLRAVEEVDPLPQADTRDQVGDTAPTLPGGMRQ